MIICEEKYKYTPDSFKAATRENRISQKEGGGISHLKSAEEILGGKKIDRSAVTGSLAGKSAISTYLAANAHRLSITRGLILDLDSEHDIRGCSCDKQAKTTIPCQCCTYSVPVRCTFSTTGLNDVTALDTIHQRKGEGEMAQLDWLLHCVPELRQGQAAVSIVTSGDIDAVVIHMFVLSSCWPRDSNGNFMNAVYVVLQKPHRMIDVYNITSIIRLLEHNESNNRDGLKVSLGLCLGGNDFIPKLQHIGHSKVLKLLMNSQYFLTKLFKIETSSITLDTTVYKDFVKHLFCGKGDPDKMSYDAIRHKSMIKQRKSSTLTPGIPRMLNDPDKWMPPASAIERLAELVNLQIKYLQIAGQHDADLPKFLGFACLRQTLTGQIEYDFGDESSLTNLDISAVTELCVTPTKTKGRKRTTPTTPQRGQRKKRAPVHSTPRKH